MYSENSNSTRFRRLMTSPAYLTAVIAFTAQIVLSLLQSILAKTMAVALLGSLLDEAFSDIGPVGPILSMFSGGFGIGTIISMLPALYMCTALWLIFAHAKKPNGAHAIMNPIGFKLINVYHIITMVLVIIAAVGSTILGILGIIGVGSVMSSYEVKGGGMATGLMILVLLVSIGVYALIIAFFNKARKLARSLADAAATGNMNVQTSTFVTVMCYILGVFMALGCVGVFLGGIFFLLNSVAGATAAIAFGIFLGKLRTELMTMDSGFANQDYIPDAAPSAPPAFSPAPDLGGTAQFDGPDFRTAQFGGPAPAPAPQLVPTAPLGRAILLRQKTGENIQVNAQNYTLGRNPAIANYVISDNPKVSGNHASILTMNGSYYLVDNNSTNHTYVNNVMVQPGTKVPLSNQSIIKLYNEVFVFLIP